MSDTGWTPTRVETLSSLWRDGLSASQVAKALGGVTRNAVIGKVHRLGLSGRVAGGVVRRPTGGGGVSAWDRQRRGGWEEGTERASAPGLAWGEAPRLPCPTSWMT